MTHIHVSQKTGKIVRYSNLFNNFPQFVVIHTVKAFSIVNEAELDICMEFPCFPHDTMNVGIQPLVPLPFLNPACTSES